MNLKYLISPFYTVTTIIFKRERERERKRKEGKKERT
jgi:hypothetical protein